MGAALTVLPSWLANKGLCVVRHAAWLWMWWLPQSKCQVTDAPAFCLLGRMTCVCGVCRAPRVEVCTAETCPGPCVWASDVLHGADREAGV